MSTTDPKVIAVAMAIKRSLEMNAGAGSAINAHPNAFFLNVNGAVDLYRAAEGAVAAATRYDEGVAALKKLAAEKGGGGSGSLAIDENAASAVCGH